MKSEKKLITIILARGGSVRIPNKNLRKIGDKSLVEIALNFCSCLKKYSDIVLSSDSKKILAEAEKFDYVLKHARKKKYSGKSSSSLVAIKNIIKYYNKKKKIKIKGAILLQPTSPFRDKKQILQTLKVFKKDNFKYNYFSIDRIKNQKEKLGNSIKLSNHFNDYHINGNFYFFNIEKIKNTITEMILDYNTYGIMTNYKNSIDIDNYKDLMFARKII